MTDDKPITAFEKYPDRYLRPDDVTSGEIVTTDVMHLERISRNGKGVMDTAAYYLKVNEFDKMLPLNGVLITDLTDAVGKPLCGALTRGIPLKLCVEDGAFRIRKAALNDQKDESGH